MNVLQVIEQGFRTTVEEQDDPIIWLTRSMRGAGADLTVLLVGHAAYYAVQQRRQPALSLYKWRQSEPANLVADIEGLVKSGVPVFVAREDIDERGLADVPLIDGVRLIGRNALAELYDRADQIWQW